MKTDQLQKITARLNGQLIEILSKLEPTIKSDFWAKNPSLQGIAFLIEKVLPVVDRAGKTELENLMTALTAAKDVFWLQKNDATIATGFVFGNVLSPADQIKQDQYFWKNIAPGAIKSKRNATRPFSYFFTAENIPGFTSNTIFKLIGKKRNGQILIIEQTTPLQGEEPNLTALNGNRAKLIEAYNQQSQNPAILQSRQNISIDFEKFCKDVLELSSTLADRFEKIEILLKHELENRQKQENSFYLHLKFEPSTNEQVKKFLFRFLNGKAFHTSEKNFYSVFTPEPTTRISWNWSLNSFLKIFFGFENLEIDGFSKSFPCLVIDRKDVFHAIAAKFDFKDKPAKPMPDYICEKSTAWQNTKPREMKHLLPFIQELNKNLV